MTFLFSLPAQADVVSKYHNDKAAEYDKQGNNKLAGDSLKKALQADASDPLVIYNWSVNKIKSVLDSQKESKNKEPTEESKKTLGAANQQLLSLADKIKGSKIPENEYHYQLGFSHESIDQKLEALKSYYKALAMTKDAKKNKDFIEKTQINILRLLSQSSSSSSKDKDQGEGGGEGDEKNKEGEQGDSKGDQERKQGQGQGDAQQTPQEPKFTGTEVDKNQAQQILNSVSNQDRQVQRKKGRMQSKQNMRDGEEGEVDPRSNDKPW